MLVAQDMEFIPFPKIPRLNRDVVITEKLDGTNGHIWIQEVQVITINDDLEAVELYASKMLPEGLIKVPHSHSCWEYWIRVGSRNRYLSHKSDNFGFWNWVNANKEEICKLGAGRHYGEWYGNGIQRNYGLQERRFALFNTERWSDPASRPKCVECVPVLYTGPLVGHPVWSNSPEGEYTLENVISWLKYKGSYAVPGFKSPEGICVFHTASNTSFKVTCENDDKPKMWKEINSAKAKEVPVEHQIPA